MKIRTAREDDIEEIAVLSGELGYPARTEDVARRWPKIATASDQAVFVAEDSGSVMGWIHVFCAYRLESGPFTEIGGLVVAESHRGRGIGRLLCEEAGRWTRDQGFGALRVRTRVEREDTHRFYERVGFRRAKSQHVFVQKLE